MERGKLYKLFISQMRIKVCMLKILYDGLQKINNMHLIEFKFVLEFTNKNLNATYTKMS